MRCAAILLALMLTGCGEEIRGGSIIGKHTKLHRGITTDTIQYYLQVKKNGQSGKVEVTKAAWDQAKQGMTWPFEIK